MVASADLTLRQSGTLAGQANPTVLERQRYRADLVARGGASAARCYQCATCTSVCELASNAYRFPRQQMLWTQHGMAVQLTADPALWLCHQCNDCSQHCPRDARPGDVMQVVRGQTVEAVSVPRAFGRLVGMSRFTWPVLIGVPILFWVLLVGLYNGGFSAPTLPLVFADVVPHWLIYVVYFPASGFAALMAFLGARRLWSQWGQGVARSGSFIKTLIDVSIEICLHRRFGSCGTAAPRRRGHFLLFWGFAVAAITSGFLVVAMYGFDMHPPLPLGNWMKILGNISAVLLLLGVISVLAHRLEEGNPAGASHAFDSFFLGLVVMLIITGMITEIARIWMDPTFAIAVYIVHLGAVLSLFLTFPYSKFAHLVYRTLAMVHEKMMSNVQAD